MQKQETASIKQILKDVCLFAQYGSRLKFRKYQVEPARAIVDSVLNRQGRSFVVMFPRQSGKNELQAQIECYLMTLLSSRPAELVKISPTWKPQTVNAMKRLERVLKANLFARKMWAKESGYILRVGDARISFFSGGPEANIVGATASTLLEVDEAQDIRIDKFDKDIAPMAASTNATRVFWGTAWTSQTLLARELRTARQAENSDGKRRVFHLNAEAVGREVAAYSAFVEEQVARLGRQHPMVKTQFFSEEIDAEAGMFPPARQALMQGSHPPEFSPRQGAVYALLLDVAGADEQARTDGMTTAGLASPKRDATALTIVEIVKDPGSLAPTEGPVYHMVFQQSWVGLAQTEQFARVRAMVELWRPISIVVDATGVGAGLASFLEKAFPGKVHAFIFTSSSKSELGWAFISLCDTGRFKVFQPDPRRQSETAEFWRQLQACQYQVLAGPAKTMRWGVEDGSRDPSNGDYLHDDLVISAALCAVLEKWDFTSGGHTFVIHGRDPLRKMDRGF